MLTLQTTRQFHNSCLTFMICICHAGSSLGYKLKTCFFFCFSYIDLQFWFASSLLWMFLLVQLLTCTVMTPKHIIQWADGEEMLCIIIKKQEFIMREGSTIPVTSVVRMFVVNADSTRAARLICTCQESHGKNVK